MNSSGAGSIIALHAMDLPCLLDNNLRIRASERIHQGTLRFVSRGPVGEEEVLQSLARFERPIQTESLRALRGDSVVAKAGQPAAARFETKEPQA